MTVKQVFNTSAELDYPKVLPTLDLDFANTKTLDPRITFTRASGGSYVGADGLIKYAGVNEARFDHDPVTGESLGLLIEESRTNRVRNSEDLTLRWSESDEGVTITTNQAVAPDGNTTADKIAVKITGDGSKFIQSSVLTGTSTGTVITSSVFCKADDHNYVRVQMEGGGNSVGINVDLSDGSLISEFRSPDSYKIEPYPNDWYRISVTSTTINTNSTALRFYLTNASGDANFTGTVGSGVYVWGGQHELGAFATSYIPTTDAAAGRTRAADIAKIENKNFSSWYNLEEGSIFIDFLNTPNSALFPYLFAFYDSITGPGENRISITKYTTNYNIRITDVTNAVTQSTYDISFGYKVFDNIKVFRTYGFKNYIGSVNGTTPRPPGFFNVANPTPSKLINSVNIGSYISGASPLNAPIKRFTYYPKALPPSQLQSLTS